VVPGSCLIGHGTPQINLSSWEADICALNELVQLVPPRLKMVCFLLTLFHTEHRVDSQHRHWTSVDFFFY
jgi:hypothetical protein